jgi:hypothetical protein
MDEKSKTSSGSKFGERKKSRDQERLVQEYFDKEVGQDKELLVQRRLYRGDREMLKELESLKEVRQELRSWLDEKLLDAHGQPRKVDLWGKLEARIEAEPVGSLSLWDRLCERLTYGLGEIRSFADETWIRPQVFVPALALILIAFYGGVHFGSGITSPYSGDLHVRLAQNDFNSRSEEQLLPLTISANEISNNQERSPFIAMVSEPQIISAAQRRYPLPLFKERVVRLAVADSNLINANKPRFEHSVPFALNASQLIQRGPVPGGLRTNGLDIDWIRTDRRFKIVSSSDQNMPPVIWLTKEGK